MIRALMMDKSNAVWGGAKHHEEIMAFLLTAQANIQSSVGAHAVIGGSQR